MSTQARAGLRVIRDRSSRSWSALPLRSNEGGQDGGGSDEFRVERKAAVGVDQRLVGDRVQIPHLILWI